MHTLFGGLAVKLAASAAPPHLNAPEENVVAQAKSILQPCDFLLIIHLGGVFNDDTLCINLGSVQGDAVYCNNVMFSSPVTGRNIGRAYGIMKIAFAYYAAYLCIL